MNISEVMTREIHTCSASDTLTECAREMAENNVGLLPVLDENGQLFGVITDRDIVIGPVAGGLDVRLERVGDFARQRMILAEPGMSIEAAADLMSDNQIRRRPVVENGRLIGIVALGDLAVKAEEQLAGHALHAISMPA